MRSMIMWVSVVAVSATLSVQPAAAQISHLGQDVGDHVVLRDASLDSREKNGCPANGSFAGRAFFRVWPDGSRSPERFTVPATRLLVITDVEWTVDTHLGGSSLIPGEAVRTRLQIGSGSTFNTVFTSRTVEVGSERGAVTGGEQLTTGVVVAPDTAICPGATGFGANIVRTARLLEIVLRGYLTTR